MDWSDNLPASKSPRKELQGPHPTPLKINKESHKIKKPPLAPQPSQPSQAPPRQPIIIYQLSPNIIHTTPGDIMNLVQRLTGASSSSDPYSFSSDADHRILTDCLKGNAVHHSASGAISPAARYAAIEKAARSASSPHHQGGMMKLEHHRWGANMGIVEEIEIGHRVLERPAGMTHGSILSPGPSSLSPIPSSLFSPPSSNPSSFSLIHDLSPVLEANRQYFLEVISCPALPTLLHPICSFLQLHPSTYSTISWTHG